jgi:signal transduction histidine kinase
VTAREVAIGLAVGSPVALVAGLALRTWLRRARSLRRQILAITLASLAAGAVVAVVLARRMVLDTDEAKTVVGVLSLTAAFAAILVLAASAPLGRDVRRLEHTVRALEGGDREVRSGVVRADELGHVATALDEAIARLDALERERSAMFSAVSHDLRTPLAALRAALEAIEDGITTDPARYVRSMQRDVEALTSLVDDLFLLARIESGALDIVRTRIDLAEIADEAVEALAPVAEAHGVVLRVDAGERVQAVGDPVALGRVIRNLVDNAIRHSPTGATVAIGVSSDGRPSVQVVDEGAGFGPAFRDVAFERFSRADASRSRTTGGTGLGLAIARGLVEAHGGEIWIDDTDRGSVSFALPTP